MFCFQQSGSAEFVWLRSLLSLCVLFYFLLSRVFCLKYLQWKHFVYSLWRCFVAASAAAVVVVSLICPATAEPALVISTRALLINTLREGGSALPSLPIFNSPASDAATNCTRGTHTHTHTCAQFCFPQSKMPPHFPGHVCVCLCVCCLFSFCFFLFLFSPFPKWSTCLAAAKVALSRFGAETLG